MHGCLHILDTQWWSLWCPHLRGSNVATNNMEWEVAFDTQVLGRAFVYMLFCPCNLTDGCRYTLVHLVLKITRTLVSVYNHCLPNAVVIVV